MADYFIGEIRPFGFGFTPQGFMQCNGALLPINQFTALFSIIGTTYGGNGVSTFGLPNIQGAGLISAGQLAGGSDYSWGEMGGSTTVTVLQTEMPSHSHAFNAGSAGTIVPEVANETNKAATTGISYLSNFVGKTSQSANIIGFGYTHTTPVNTQLAVPSITPTGGSQAHNNMPPYLTINYCIAVTGVFPTRN